MNFFLGGIDLEMLAIKNVLITKGIAFCDKGLGWGAHASAYASEIAQAVSEGEVIVLLELDNEPRQATKWDGEKIPVSLPSGTIIVDHHGDRAGEPASILQVLDLLGLEPSRHQQLIAADDSGGPVGLVAFGATPEEFTAVRTAGRTAQGITLEQEEEATRAVAASEKFGGAVIVRCAHSKCAPITDRLFPSWEDGRENLLILSEDGEVNYFGKASVRNALKQRFGGYLGGNPEGNGFWGTQGVSQEDILSLFKECVVK